MELVKERISDRRVLKLIRQWLAAGVMEDGTVRETLAGTPQGGVISPWLANVYLNYLDRLWQARCSQLGLLVSTSGIVLTVQGRQIALYFTGRQHAGENIADALKQRAKQSGPPIQMCDALSRNVPKSPAGVEILLANCLAHAATCWKCWARCPATMPKRVSVA